MLILFVIALFVSATLLFLVQPMFAKMVLPTLGGTPAVWNTCMVFFQAALLAGYGYAHATTQRLGVRRQAALQLSLLLLPLFVLPIRVPAGWAPPAQQNPLPWLLAVLALSVGLPFFVLSTMAPTLQMWYAHTGHPYARDPYFLYGASNLGSMIALLAYPVLLEPNLRLADQSWVWTCGYALLVVLAAGCAAMLWRSPAVTQNSVGAVSSHSPNTASAPNGVAGLAVAQRARWVALAFVPSSLLLGVTAALTTEIPAIPLLWVIPLTVYLLTFVLVFAKKPTLSHEWMIRRMPFLVLASTIPIVSKALLPVWVFVPLHVLTLFVVAMVCHGELARSRPPTEHLTAFFLSMSAGGVLGGIFNSLVAPLVFKTVAEYPLVLVVASLLRPRLGQEQEKDRSARWLDFVLPIALGALLAGLIWSLQAGGTKPSRLLHILLFGPTMMLCLSFAPRPTRFGLGVGALLLASTLYVGPYGRALHTERSFFGVHRVTQDSEGKYRMLVHGSTIHGVQSLDPSRQREPLSYFSRTGPIGQVFAAFSGSETIHRVAVVGLGTGSVACYGEPGQQFTFYEIDPVVERIARDPRYFTFLRDCRPKIAVVLGDARLSLVKGPNRQYDMIILDAFSSDAIPMHLVTREAMKLYLAKLSDGGILAFHISSRYLNLQPVLGDLARDEGLLCLGQNDTNVSPTEIENGKFPSQWVVMARKRGDLRNLAQDERWQALPGRPEKRAWSDDFSSILGIIRWR